MSDRIKTPSRASSATGITPQSHFARRRFIKGAAAALTAAVLPTFAVQRSVAIGTGQSADTFEQYQRLFPDLSPAKFDPADLARLALGDGAGLIGMSSDPEPLLDASKNPRKTASGGMILSATPETEADDEENFGIPAGYTYFGQFIDHDLTHNADDRLGVVVDPKRMTNLRTACFDLDSLYGTAPQDQPYLYQADGRHLAVGRLLNRMGQSLHRFDVLRANGRALIGDARNDENVILNQLHAAFIAFHNMVADDRPGATLADLQKIVRHHYQWIVLTDFLPRIAGREAFAEILGTFGEGGKTGTPPPPSALTANLGTGSIPMEFTDAVYRFGHSMIRPIYRLNTRMHGTDDEKRDNPAIAGRRFIFAASPYAGLNGFREFPAEWAIDWGLFFEIDSVLSVDRIKEAEHRVQPSYKLDTSLVNPLAFLPEFSAPKTGIPPKGAELKRDTDGHPMPAQGLISNLAHRNLMRGLQHGMPSGQDVAKALGHDPIADNDIRIGKANLEGLATNQPITAFGDSFKGAAPLWTYVLAEAQFFWTQQAKSTSGTETQRNAIPTRLGPVGGRIIVETMVALMRNDRTSILYQGPNWKPNYARDGRFTVAELLMSAKIT